MLIDSHIKSKIEGFEKRLDRIVELLERLTEIESHRAWQEDAVHKGR